MLRLVRYVVLFLLIVNSCLAKDNYTILRPEVLSLIQSAVLTDSAKKSADFENGISHTQSNVLPIPASPPQAPASVNLDSDTSKAYIPPEIDSLKAVSVPNSDAASDIDDFTTEIESTKAESVPIELPSPTSTLTAQSKSTGPIFPILKPLTQPPIKSVQTVPEPDKQRMSFFSLFKSSQPEEDLTVQMQPPPDLRVGTAKTTHVGAEYENFTSFICYRQSTSRSLAMLIKVLLDREKIAAFLDVEDLKSGYWDEQLDHRLNSAQTVLLILSAGSLDPCLNDTKYEDLMHQEIREAVITGKRIIPIFDEFDFPCVDGFSEEIQTALRFQGVDWQHQFTEASFHKLLEYLAEEIPPPAPTVKGYKIHATPINKTN